MENFDQAKRRASHELPEHSGINGPELQLPTPTPEIGKKPNISPEALNDLIVHIDDQYEKDEERDKPKGPTLQ